MADKFTPYALTALPAAQNRDVNGIYFIRTANGMEVYAIANTPTRDVVPLKVGGYVDLISTQNIAGRKIFDVAIGVDGYNDGQTGGYPNVPNKIFIQKHNKGTMFSLYDVGDSGGIFRVFELDFKNLKTPPTSLEVMHLEQSTKVAGEKGLEGEAVNYLGWKKVFDITSYQIDLTANVIRTIELTPGALPVLAWDNGQAFMQGTHWDIVWEEIGPGQAYRKFSLKDTYGRHVLSTTELRRPPIGGQSWQLRLAVDINLTIPEGAKLVIW